MINFTNLPQSVTAAVGALLISTLFVVAAVGPAHAVGAGPAQTALVQSSDQAHA